MEKIIKDFKVEDDKEEIKNWYDGYKIGQTNGIYNPWSILNYVKNRELVPYWVNTSSNDLIKLVLKNSTTVKEKIERLLKGEEIEVIVDQETVIQGVEKNEDNVLAVDKIIKWKCHEMTIEEIEEKLGYKVKIVGEKGEN